MTQDVWLTKHPYLQQVAHLHAQIDAAVAGGPNASPGIPRWDDYLGDFLAGVPLLRSSSAAVDLGPAERLVGALVERLVSNPLPGNLAAETRALAAELCRDSDSPRRIITWLVEDDDFVPAHPGLMRFLGWTALSRYLHPLTEAFDRWRDEDRWLRGYCPACGSPPAMAQLVGVDPGRRRFLSCGRCRTRWCYRRTGCPFCENEDNRRLAVLTVQGEGGLRIDYCSSCQGYLKTYDGEGSEPVLLADWTSIHLDLLARDRGLKRLAASLYEL